MPSPLLENNAACGFISPPGGPLVLQRAELREDRMLHGGGCVAAKRVVRAALQRGRKPGPGAARSHRAHTARWSGNPGLKLDPVGRGCLRQDWSAEFGELLQVENRQPPRATSDGVSNSGQKRRQGT